MPMRFTNPYSHILVLGAATCESAGEAIAYGLTQTVFTPEMVEFLDMEASRRQRVAFVHIKLDTGMNRIGLKTIEDAEKLACVLDKCSHVKANGIYTHFAEADSPDEDDLNAFSQEQLERFYELRSCFSPLIPAHVANSAAGILSCKTHLDFVREGISLYGYPPVGTVIPFRPALSWMTEVTNVKIVHAGETIGYGRTYTADRDMRVATVAVGYGDGYHRSLSNRGQMLIRGCRAPIVGRVCMDQTMVDVTDIPEAAVGDEVVLLGSQGEEIIDAEQLAAWADTISYEMLLAPSQRVHRFYINLQEMKGNGNAE